MFRVTKLSKWYAVEFGDEIDDVAKDDIEQFVSEGVPVVIVEDLADMEDLGVSEDEIQIVIKEE